MKRRGFSLLEVVVLLAAISILAAVLFPVFSRVRERDAEDERKVCQTNLKQLALGVKQYIQDYDELYPTVTSGGNTFGWADALQPYVKSHRVFHCPTRGAIPANNPRANSYTDYWYNHRLSRQNESAMNNSALIILMGDGNDGRDITNARYAKSELPKAWKTDRTKPPFRHLEGADYSFVDGHVKWLKPDKITTQNPNTTSAYSFVVG